MNPLLKKVYDAQAAEYSRENQDLVDYTVTAVLDEVANYLKETILSALRKACPYWKTGTMREQISLSCDA